MGIRSLKWVILVLSTTVPCGSCTTFPVTRAAAIMMNVDWIKNDNDKVPRACGLMCLDCAKNIQPHKKKKIEVNDLSHPYG